jgi:hypothetical protein
MAGFTVETGASLMCPHGGTVQVLSANTRTKAAGGFIALATDTFVVVGCPFHIPATPPIPSPCVTVRWIVTDVRSRVNGRQTLSRSSAGICQSAAQVPQGPVSVVATQTRVETQ